MVGDVELVLLRTLLAVTETGSFSAAASRLCITQSAVSRRIRQLEEHYGVSLLDRAGPVIKLTHAGGALADKAKQMLDLEHEIEEAVSAHAQRSRISFCCTPGFGIGRLPDVFERFASAAGSNIDLNIVFRMPEDVFQGLSGGLYDLAVVEHCEDLDLAAYPAFALPGEDVLFVSAPSMGLDETLVTLDRLIGERLYLKTHNGCAYRFLQRGLRRIGRRIEEFGNIAYFDDLAVVVRQVVDGHGIGFASRDLVERELAAGALRAHRLDGFDHHRARTLLLSDRGPLPDATQRFIRTLYETLKISPPPALFADAPSPAIRATRGGPAPAGAGHFITHHSLPR
jgi:DNA-binding transcriptional LysR family regulator